MNAPTHHSLLAEAHLQSSPATGRDATAFALSALLHAGFVLFLIFGPRPHDLFQKRESPPIQLTLHRSDEVQHVGRGSPGVGVAPAPAVPREDVVAAPPPAARRIAARPQSPSEPIAVESVQQPMLPAAPVPAQQAIEMKPALPNAGGPVVLPAAPLANPARDTSAYSDVGAKPSPTPPDAYQGLSDAEIEALAAADLAKQSGDGGGGGIGGGGYQTAEQKRDFSVYRDVAGSYVHRRWQPNIIINLMDPDATPETYSGRVTVVSVRINRHGEVLDVRVRKSSGIDFIDDEAINTLHAASPLPEPPKHLLIGGEVKFDIRFVLGRGNMRDSSLFE